MKTFKIGGKAFDSAYRESIETCQNRGKMNEKPGQHLITFCPECGLGVEVDASGWCTTCKRDAIGTAVDELHAEKLPDLVARLSGKVEDLRKENRILHDDRIDANHRIGKLVLKAKQNKRLKIELINSKVCSICEEDHHALRACTECYNKAMAHAKGGTELDDLRAERDELKLRLERSNELNDSLQGWHKRNDQLNKRLSMTQQENDDLEEEKKIWWTENNELRAENDKLKAEPADFGTILELRAEHEEEVERLKTINDRLVRQRDRTMAKVVDVKAEVDGLIKANARLIDERDQADARRKEAQAACEEWRVKAQDYACSF